MEKLKLTTATGDALARHGQFDHMPFHRHRTADGTARRSAFRRPIRSDIAAGATGGNDPTNCQHSRIAPDCGVAPGCASLARHTPAVGGSRCRAQQHRDRLTALGPRAQCPRPHQLKVSRHA